MVSSNYIWCLKKQLNITGPCVYCFDFIILIALCSFFFADKIYSKMGEGNILWLLYELFIVFTGPSVVLISYSNVA